MKRPLFVTVRSGNTRFPYKTLQPLWEGCDTITLMFHRLAAQNDIHFACPWGDDAMAKQIKERMLNLYWDRNGNLPLMRAVAFGEYYELEHFVFVCGDSPLLDQQTLDRLWHQQGKAPFVFMEGPSGFRAKLIETAAARRWLDHCREQEEHAFSGLMTPFKAETITLYDYSEGKHNFSLDTSEDLFFIKEVLRRTGPDADLRELGIAADHVVNNYPHLRTRKPGAYAAKYPSPGAS